MTQSLRSLEMTTKSESVLAFRANQIENYVHLQMNYAAVVLTNMYEIDWLYSKNTKNMLRPILNIYNFIRQEKCYTM